MPAPPRDAPPYVGTLYRLLLDRFLPWDSGGWEVDRLLGAYTYTTGAISDDRDDSDWRAEVSGEIETWLRTGEPAAVAYVDKLLEEKLWPIDIRSTPAPAQLPLPKVAG